MKLTLIVLAILNLTTVYTFDNSTDVDLSTDKASTDEDNKNGTKIAYFLSGFDNEGRPVWVVDAGQMRVPDQVYDEGGNSVDLYVQQYVSIFSAQLAQGFSMANEAGTTQNLSETQSEYALLIDCTDIDFSFMTQYHYLSSLSQAYEENFAGNLSYGYLLNMGVVSRSVLYLVRTVAPSVLSKFDSFGDVDSYGPAVFEKMEKNQVPSYLGGEKTEPYLLSFEPIEKVVV